MHGFFRSWRTLPLAAVATVALAAGCSKMVPQDKATGEDGKQKGAKELVLENDESFARGIVTYPGGDRVDWKVLDLPADTSGNLEVTLTWKPPRPKLRLGVEVWDEWGKKIDGFEGKKNSSKYKATGVIADARGKLFIRVYAVGRGDAGTYKLHLGYSKGSSLDPRGYVIPEPPKLAAVPKGLEPCDPFAFDRKNPACATQCPAVFDASWPGCAGKCPTPPDPNNPACQGTMACPTPPDRKIKSCPKSAWPACDMTKPKDPSNPNCDGAKMPPVRGQVKDVQQQSDVIIITINRGKKSGVDKGWSGQILDSAGNAISGGGFVVYRVTEDKCYGKVKLQTDTVRNASVELTAP